MKNNTLKLLIGSLAIAIAYILFVYYQKPEIPTNTQGGALSYWEVPYSFSFFYNKNFSVKNEAKEYTKNWRVNADDDGILITAVSVPRSYLPNTNFSEAKLTVGASVPTTLASCLTGDGGNGVQETSLTINGLPFKKLIFGDAGAGNYYETTSYRGIVDGDCYTIEYTIHSTNIGNYSPDQGIKEFDKPKIVNDLEATVQSFKFLVNSD